MQDRLRSLKYFRAMRDICFCLGAALLLESAFLLTNYLIWGHRFLLSGVLFLALATMSGYMAYYFHGRFRRRR